MTHEPLRVLMIEDSPTDAKLIMNELQRQRLVHCERVETAEAMRAALAKSWDVVLSDWSMPKFSARAALDVLKSTGIDLPFIIVSGTIGEDTAVEAMRAGACDYVIKDRLTRLMPAIEREIREAHDRAARRSAESALKHSEARFERLSSAGIIGIVLADIHGNVLDANDAYLRMIGYTRDELTQGLVRWDALLPTEQETITASALAELQTSGKIPSWETELQRRDGTRIAILAGAALLDHPNIIAFVADVTERKQAEMGRARAELALRQSEEQLRQAQKMEAVGRLAGGVAHDFNNILSVILSYAEVMEMDLNAADPLHEYVQEITKASRRAATLTRQLLLFSRRQIAEPKVVDLHELLVGMEKMLERMLGEDVALSIVTPKENGRVRADPNHIEQVVMNLVVNARDAMPTGGKLTIETSNIVLDETYAAAHLPAKPGSYVMLAVTDNGTGIEPAVQARMFEPFFTTKGTGQGTGLGLSTVFGIVQQSGGNIWVYSELGRGTTFKIYLPRVDGDVDIAQASTAPATLRGTETILLVEDEEQVRTIVFSVLKRHGYNVISAQNAGEALLLCERHTAKIDLLLTDVVMPNMSGPELAKRLLATRPEIKVLCMSGYTDDTIVRHGIVEEGIAYYEKPVTPATLLAKVRSILGAKPDA